METKDDRRSGAAMKLWLIWQNQNKDYDSFDSAVVAAETEKAAVRIIPGSGAGFSTNVWSDEGKLMYVWPDGSTRPDIWNAWATDLIAVEVKYLGEAAEGTEAGVVLASFNAG